MLRTGGLLRIGGLARDGWKRVMRMDKDKPIEEEVEKDNQLRKEQGSLTREPVLYFEER